MLRNLSIVRKLGLGFGVLVLLLCGISLIGWYSLSRASDGFDTYRGIARDVKLMEKLQANMFLTRMSVKDFVRDFDETSSTAYDQAHQETERLLAEARSSVHTLDRSAKIAAVEQAVQGYHQAFQEMRALQTERQQLVQASLDIEGPKMADQLGEIMHGVQQTDDLVATYETGLALKHLLLARLGVHQVLNSNKPLAIQEVHQQLEQLQQHLTKLDQQLEDPARHELLSEIIQAEQRYRQSFERAIATLEQQNTLVLDRLETAGPQIAANIEAVSVGLGDDMHQIGPQVQQANQTAIVWIAIGSAVAIVMGIMLAVVIGHSISGPIRRSVVLLKDIAEGEGDLTKRLQIESGGEVGELAHWFNVFVDKIHAIIVQVASEAGELANASCELSATATQLTSGAEDARTRATTVSANSEEMSINMNNMASAGEEMTTNLQSISNAISEMSVSINEISRSTESASSISIEAAANAADRNVKLASLGEAAIEVGQIIEVIEDIAEQTNLLALNATIEAARAGEAGKGFAVVATEVKELAHQTATATEDIRGRIGRIQSSSEEAVTSMQRIHDVIEQLKEVNVTIASAVEEQGVTTREISRNVTDSSEAAALVASGVSQSAMASKEITQVIGRMAQVSTETAQCAGQTQAAGHNLSRLSDEMHLLVSRFQT